MKVISFTSKAISAIAVVALLLPALAFAQSGIEPYDFQRNGLAGWQFLKINGSPRHAALGGATTAVPNPHADAVFGNPALLADIDQVDVFLSKVNWIADIGHQSAAVATRLPGWGVVGLSVVSVDMGDMAETINSPIAGESRTEAVVTGNTFTAGDLAIGLSYAKRVTDRLAVGGNVRWIRESIADVSMSNVSFDFGTSYATGFRSLRLALTARNLGPDTNLAGWSEEYQAEAVDIRMPVDFRLGVSMDFFDTVQSPHFMTVSVEGLHPNDGPERVHAGLEYTFANLISLRGGYRFNYDEESFTFGGGVQYDAGAIGLKVDYGYVDFGRLSNVHMFSLGISF